MNFGLALVRDQISHDAHESGAWRNAKASQFPDDPRNKKAAARLLELAGTTDADSTLLVRILDHPHYSKIRKATSAACRDVGFRFAPRTLDDLYARILENLDELNGLKH